MPDRRPAINPLRAVNIVCLILSDLRPDTRTFAFDAARKFVNRELRPNTFIGVFGLDLRGLHVVFPFSNNREQLLKAVELAATNQLPGATMRLTDMLNGLSMSPAGEISPGNGGSAGDPLGSRGDMGLMQNSGLDEIDALIKLVRQLSPLPFHKTVLLFSPGMNRPADLLEYWDSLIQQAAKGGVTFYAMDVHGLDPSYDPMAQASAMLQYTASLSAQPGAASIRPSGAQVGNSPGGGPMSAGGAAQMAASHNQAPSSFSAAQQMMELAHQDDYLKFTVSSANAQEAIRELAERTGGFLIANTNNTDQLLAHVMEDVDTHYEIAYPSTAERDDGHFRKIEVELTRPGMRVETRSGYFAVPATGSPLTPEEMAGLNALDTKPQPHAFDFRSRAYRFRDAEGGTQYAITFQVPIASLTATAEEDAGKQRLHASLLAVVKNPQGQIVDRIGKDVPSEISGEGLAAVRTELMTYEHAVSLPPGHYRIETAVVDHEGRRASTGEVEIDNREQPGVGLSDLTLVRRLENLNRPPDAADPFEFNASEFEFAGKRVLPFVTTELPAGTTPSVYFVVYPDPASPSKPELHVRLFKNGRQVASRRVPAAAPDASGGIPMWMEETGQPGS